MPAALSDCSRCVLVRVMKTVVCLSLFVCVWLLESANRMQTMEFGYFWVFLGGSGMWTEERMLTLPWQWCSSHGACLEQQQVPVEAESWPVCASPNL